MGATTKYALPYPAGTAALKVGYAAIQALAEKVEDVLLPPLLLTTGTGDPDWTAKVGRLPWDVTDDPTRKRGAWDSPGSAERLVLPPSTGYYFVAASMRFAGKAEPDSYRISIETKEVGEDEADAVVWISQQFEAPSQDSGTFTQLAVAGLVRIGNDDTGIQVKVQYTGSTTPPTTGTGVNKLQIFKQSAL